MTRTGEETQSGQLTPADQRNIPDYMPSCSSRKAAGKKEKGGEIWSDIFLFPASYMWTGWSPYLPMSYAIKQPIVYFFCNLCYFHLHFHVHPEKTAHTKMKAFSLITEKDVGQSLHR